MKNVRKKTLIELCIILFLGLTPLLWYHGNQIILGHDSGLTLSPVSHFLDRFFAWTDRFGYGVDQSYAIPGVFIHGLEALISYLGFSLQAMQKIEFIFWFILPGITMYYFARKLEKELNLSFFALPTTIFYMFNHFLLQGWFIAERTKFSLYAAAPLILVFLFDWEKEKRSTIKTALLISITLCVLNAEASLPLFGGLILMLLVFLLFYFIQSFTFRSLSRLVYLTVSVFVSSALLNLYWLLPYGYFVLHFFSEQVAERGGLSGVLGWVDYESSNSSLINLLRLQGIPEWYQNPLHPYASVFMHNVFLILISVLIPIAAFLPLYFMKKLQKRYILFFSVLALISMIFVAGSHQPFGALYLLFIKVIPGFLVFRSPYYKFASSLFLAYAILIGFTVDYGIRKIHSIPLRFVSLAIVIFVILAYNYPYFTGVFFNYEVGQRSMKVTVPSYIQDFGKWSSNPSRSSLKTLMLPPQNQLSKVETYTWGFWSLSPLTSLLTNAPTINDSSYLTDNQMYMTEQLYQKMRDNDPSWENLARFLGISSFVVRKDFAWKESDSPTDDPSLYLHDMNDPDLVHVKTFGQWEVYDFKNPVPIATKVTHPNYIDGGITDMGTITSLPDFHPEEGYYINGINKGIVTSQIMSQSQSVFTVAHCVRCTLLDIPINTDQYIPTISPESKLYKLIHLFSHKAIDTTPANYVYTTLSDALEFQKQLAEGKDTITLLQSLQAYHASLSILAQGTQQLEQSFSEGDNNVLADISDVLHAEEGIMTPISVNDAENSTLDPSVRSLFNDTYTQLQTLKSDIDTHTWRTTDLTNKKLVVNIPLDNSYTIQVHTDATQSARISYTIDGDLYTVIPSQIQNSSWESLGKISLTSGSHKIAIDIPPVTEFNQEAVQITNGECFQSPQIIGKMNDVYEISFNNKLTEGNGKFKFSINYVNPVPGETNASSIISPSDVFSNFNEEFQIPQNATFYTSFCSLDSANLSSVATAQLAKFSIQRFVTPDIVFSTSNSLNGSSSPINLTKNSNTQYSSTDTVNPNDIVVFNETFSPFWKLDSNNANHFTLNTYANAWIITTPSKISIQYDTQKFVRTGFIISIIAGILCIIGIFIF